MFYSPLYHTDEYCGVCLDGDACSVRYARNDNGRVYKMKAGKFMRHLLDVNFPELGEAIKNHVCETFLHQWSGYIESMKCSLELRVNDDFDAIYDSHNYYGDSGFGSCMTDKGFAGFYRNCVDALAAGLWDGNGLLQARCVIFTDVERVCDGRSFRLAERQYSAGGDELLKQILVNRLIAEGYIDGYKMVGAGCRENNAFLLNDGTSLRDDLFIKVSDIRGYDVPYMDSFKYYCGDEDRAYNNEDYDHTHMLYTTSGYPDELEEPEDCEVYYWQDSCWMETFVSESIRDDYYVYIDRLSGYYERAYLTYSELLSEYIPDDKAVHSDYSGEYMWECDCVWSKLLDDYLPKEDFEDIESEWKKKHWPYASVVDEHVPEITEVHIWNGDTHDYDIETDDVINENNYYCYDGELYDLVDDETGIPFILDVPAEACA